MNLLVGYRVSCPVEYEDLEKTDKTRPNGFGLGGLLAQIKFMTFGGFGPKSWVPTNNTIISWNLIKLKTICQNKKK